MNKRDAKFSVRVINGRHKRILERLKSSYFYIK